MEERNTVVSCEVNEDEARPVIAQLYCTLGHAMVRFAMCMNTFNSPLFEFSVLRFRSRRQRMQIYNVTSVYKLKHMGEGEGKTALFIS